MGIFLSVRAASKLQRAPEAPCLDNERKGGEFKLTRTNWSMKVLFLVVLVAAQGSRADQVVLKNGDRVTGAIVKKDGKTLTIRWTGRLLLPKDFLQQTRDLCRWVFTNPFFLLA